MDVVVEPLGRRDAGTHVDDAWRMPGGRTHRVFIDGVARADVSIIAARRVVRTLLVTLGGRREHADQALREHVRRWAVQEAGDGRLLPQHPPPTILLPVNASQVAAILQLCIESSEEQPKHGHNR